ncbi:MAG: nucleotidyltransferase domain-containing protein [Candidatus Bathyarchaeota archaeon]|nr:nucleotidyltransferase domain-containing protein [Candidatus Bathyarchaeota archaeon]
MSDRSSVAREAARLLYSGAAEEYIQAKEMAAASLGAKSTPSNYEVAIELDRLADEAEGGVRQRRLTEMRGKALALMRDLKGFSPRLIGSVWRGTARRGSDIDLVVLARSPSDLEAPLADYEIRERGEVNFKGGVHAYHLKIDLGGDEAEVVVRDPAEYEEERCDIYGDVKRGLTLAELERLLRTDPIRKFVPRRRSR